jgi:hypothetical protein
VSLVPADLPRRQLDAGKRWSSIPIAIAASIRAVTAQAEVNPAAEREVLVLLAADVQSIGIGKTAGSWLAASRAENEIAALDLLSTEFQILRRRG